MTFFQPLFTGLSISCIIALLLIPQIIKLSLRYNFTDQPGGRKVHRKPVPVVGGIAIMLTLAASLIVPELRAFMLQYKTVTICMYLLAVTGAIDDKYNISPVLRLVLQLFCTFAVAHSGIRITSFHGFLGIGALPLAAQYAVTVFVITAVTNSYNLLDGIDGWAGSMAAINLGILGAISQMMGITGWAVFLFVLAGAVLAFLRYNWHPAKLFMGDCGSLSLGFTMAVAGIFLLQKTSVMGVPDWLKNNMPVILSALFALPVIDALRVFMVRMYKGKSPLSADKTHLHHKLIRHFLIHATAARRMLVLHMGIIGTTLVLRPLVSISVIMILQVALVLFYTALLDFAHNYSRWYRVIKRLEAASE